MPSISLNLFIIKTICLDFYILQHTDEYKSTISTQHTSVISSETLLEPIFPPLVKPSSFAKEWHFGFSVSDIFSIPQLFPVLTQQIHPVRRKSRLKKVYLAKRSEFTNHSMAKASLLKIHNPRLHMWKMT